MLFERIAAGIGAPPPLQVGDLAALHALDPSVAAILPVPAVAMLALAWASAIMMIGIELRAEKID